MRQLEAKLQQAIFDYIRTVAPSVFVFHPANGGHRLVSEAVRLRNMGVVAGVPDLCIVQPLGKVHFLEVKTKGGTLSKAQKAIRDRFINMAVDCAVVTSLEEVKVCLKAWKIPTREVSE